MNHLRLITWQPAQPVPQRPTVVRLARRARRALFVVAKHLAAGVLIAVGALLALHVVQAAGQKAASVQQPVSAPACKVDRSV
ncbi:hypothetical protein [Herbaspirillum sp. YR522]|uniref:hypothetical protein n=1 Tax=Herbaspirillum sp. YR522 TaxID=1144342 RepID=UPI00026FA297|nr:hypothetical protein [Herbaspirillum sp. YR522]EJN06457.1 hypothetical protein PMI40_02243 [Herbaspirillum sp. YR522]